MKIFTSGEADENFRDPMIRLISNKDENKEEELLEPAIALIEENGGDKEDEELLS